MKITLSEIVGALIEEIKFYRSDLSEVKVYGYSEKEILNMSSDADKMTSGVPVRDVSSRSAYPGTWTHSKGGEYRILGFGLIEDGMIPSVIYQSVKDGSVWIRPCANFFDGRFKPEIR